VVEAKKVTVGRGNQQLSKTAVKSKAQQSATDETDGSTNVARGNSAGDDIFPSIRTDELALSRAGEAAFNRGDYQFSLKCYQQAQKVESSGVWQSGYPFFAGDLFLLGQPEQGKKALNEMISKIASKQGYIGWKTTVGMVINNLGNVRNKLTEPDQRYFDTVIDRVIQLRQTAKE
jgi:hypothetical protein